MAHDVVFYEDHRGYSPVGDKLEELFEKAETNKSSRIMYDKWASYMSYLEEKGTRLQKQIVEHLEDGIYELKPKRYRILFYMEGNTIVYLHYFYKDTQKTPREEIEKAKRERADWKNRNK